VRCYSHKKIIQRNMQSIDDMVVLIFVLGGVAAPASLLSGSFSVVCLQKKLVGE